MKLFTLAHICPEHETQLYSKLYAIQNYFIFSFNVCALCTQNTKRERDFNECLIQNHLHAYRAHGIIAIIFYCGSKNYIFVLAYGNVCVCTIKAISTFYSLYHATAIPIKSIQMLNLIYWFIG